MIGDLLQKIRVRRFRRTRRKLQVAKFRKGLLRLVAQLESEGIPTDDIVDILMYIGGKKPRPACLDQE